LAGISVVDMTFSGFVCSEIWNRFDESVLAVIFGLEWFKESFLAKKFLPKLIIKIDSRATTSY
jgi:hypothetical protein